MQLPTGSGKLFGRDGAWVEGQYLHWLQTANRVTDVMTYQQFIQTDKYAPTVPPQSVTITSIAGGGGTRQAKIDWVEATTNPLDSRLNYDLYIYYFNTADPTKNNSTIVGAGRTGTSFTFANAGLTGDTGCYAQLSYQDPITGFASANAETAHITL